MIGAAIAALLVLSRRRTTTDTATGDANSPALASSMWAVSDALQQSHLNALADQVATIPTRADVTALIDQALSKLPIGPAFTRTDVTTLIDQAINKLPTAPSFTRDDASAMIQQAISGLGSGGTQTGSVGTDRDLAAQFNQEMA